MILKILLCLCLIILTAAQKFVQNRCQESDRNTYKNKFCIQVVVCGWYKRNIKCIKYPFASTYGNPCLACADPKVAYYTYGVCPALI